MKWAVMMRIQMTTHTQTLAQGFKGSYTRAFILFFFKINGSTPKTYIVQQDRRETTWCVESKTLHNFLISYAVERQ